MALTLPAICCALALGVGQVTFPSTEWVTIEGRHNPELLPEYLVWRSGFRELGGLNSPSDPVFVKAMRLPLADARRVFDEARAQTERDRVCSVNQDRTLSKMSNATPADTLAATQAIVLECRWQVLHAQARLLETLSPDAQVALVSWMNAYRATITVRVLKQELEFFRKPR